MTTLATLSFSTGPHVAVELLVISIHFYPCFSILIHVLSMSIHLSYLLFTSKYPRKSNQHIWKICVAPHFPPDFGKSWDARSASATPVANPSAACGPLARTLPVALEGGIQRREWRPLTSSKTQEGALVIAIVSWFISQRNYSNYIPYKA